MTDYETVRGFVRCWNCEGDGLFNDGPGYGITECPDCSGWGVVPGPNSPTDE